VILILSNSTLFSQGCLPEGIEFNTQEQIDDFQTNYPGCTEINGNVMIFGVNITNLNGLNVLLAIHGDLMIGWVEFGNPFLTTLSGLNNLNTNDGNLWINYNYMLESLEGLENLNSIGHNITITGNDSLANLTGLGNLHEIAEDLDITENNALTNLTGLESLISIGEGLYIYGNNNLTDLTGIENLASIGDALRIQNNIALTSLIGLENLSSIGNDLLILGNPSLESLSGLNNLSAGTISGVYISGNCLLSICNVQALCDYLIAPKGSVNIYNNADGCDNPSEVANTCGISLSCLPYGNYYFFNQKDIEDFQINYPGCNNLEGLVHIKGDSIINLNGLSVLTSIGGNLWIENNPSLTSLSGLSNLNFIGDALAIWDNNSLTSLSGLENLDSINQSLDIRFNDALSNFTGLDNLSFIGGSILIWNNNSLTSIDGLKMITSISGVLHIYYNPALTSITGFESLSSIGGYLWIEGNKSLKKLTGLNHIDGDSITYLIISNNDSLFSCEVESICNYLANPNGAIEIKGNATGCNSQEEVEEACDTLSVKFINFDSEISIFPNPGKNLLIISTPNGATILEVLIYNHLGQKVQQWKPVNNTLDMSKLQQGLYIIELVTEQVNIRKKLLVE